MASINFKGKTAVWNHHLSVLYHTLEKDKKNSLEGKNDTENLIIEGDNLLALKALLPKYQGKVKCIYIDPPYNTGNEGWVYNDKVNNPVIKNWIGEVVGKDGEDLVRHDKWLAMMTPRLKLLKELLSDDGVILISIDDVEIAGLRMLMNEIFGTSNHLGTIIWKKKTNGNNVGDIPPVHDYIVVYCKTEGSEPILGFPMTEDEIAATYKNPDSDPNGPWTTMDLSANHKGPHFPIKNPKTGKVYLPAEGRYWVFNEEEVKRRIKDGRIIFGKTGDAGPIQKTYLKDKQVRKKAESWWDNHGFNSDGTTELKELFGAAKIFDHSKPSTLIKHLLNITTVDDDIILDSFAGTGTTGQSVLELNAEDGGRRKFILVQIAEEIKSDNPAYKEGYRWVHEITRDRVKKVIKRDKLDVGFTYYTLGPDIDGKKILTGKNMPTWDVMAKYVHFLATGKPIDEVTMAKKTWEITATRKGTGVYLIYADTLEELKKLAITRDWLEAVKDKAGKKIVYAPACFLDKEILDEYNISFVQVPFNLFTRK